MSPMPRISALERFKQKYKVNEETGCWEWTAQYWHGSGVFTLHRKKVRLAHVFAYETYGGMLKEGHKIIHTCNNSRCVNPEHLEQVSTKDLIMRRFQSSYEINSVTGCWEWLNYLGSDGYGQFSDKYKTLVAHRFSYERLVGPIPEGLTLDHLCKNKKCVNPEHLEPVTRYVNTIRGKGSSSLYCSKGHPMFGEYLWFNKHDNRRRCLECIRISNRKSKHKHMQKKKTNICGSNSLCQGTSP